MIPLLQMRRNRNQAKADSSDQICLAGREPDRWREMSKAADDDGRERHAGDEQQIQQPPIEVLASDIFGARSNFDPDVARKGPGVTYADSERPPFMSKILSFFSAFPDCSIDFGQFILMFRVDAAQYRNAMLRVSRLSAYPKSRANLRAVPGLSATAFSEIPSGGICQRLNVFFPSRLVR
jgi:hypothetical protein